MALMKIQSLPVQLEAQPYIPRIHALHSSGQAAGKGAAAEEGAAAMGLCGRKLRHNCFMGHLKLVGRQFSP